MNIILSNLKTLATDVLTYEALSCQIDVKVYAFVNSNDFSAQLS